MPITLSISSLVQRLLTTQTAPDGRMFVAFAANRQAAFSRHSSPGFHGSKMLANSVTFKVA
jgi:hypothetical protein